MKCSAKRHHAQPGTNDVPIAVLEWFDSFNGKWRPLCADCLDETKRIHDAARAEFNDEPAALAGFDAARPFHTRPLR